jgi:integrase/recombinase XerD
MTALRQRYLEDLQLRGLSPRTQESYVRVVRQLAEHYGKSPDVLTEEELRQYLLYLKNEKHAARNTCTLALCSLKLFYQQTLKRDWPVLDFVRPARDRKLPVVLSVEEVQRILGCVRRARYRVCLSLIYACGLRLLEGVRLPVADVDGARMVIHVRHGKGGQDRYVPLPRRTLELLREYWSCHRDPVWLFPGMTPGGGPMCATGVQRAFKAALAESGIHKQASVHTLRHSWATHLLEAGVISLARDYVNWFQESYGTTRCQERTGVDFRTMGGLIGYMLPGHRMVRCMSHINGAMKYLYDAQRLQPPTTRRRLDRPANPVHCAQAVLEGVRANTGIGDPILERISIVLDGGVGLQGGACGALAGAVLALNLPLGMNLRDASLPRAYYAFFKGLSYLRSEKAENIPDPFNVGKRIVMRFEREAGSIDCSDITGERFADWDAFQSYVRSSEKCRGLIESSIQEATLAIQGHMTAG